MIIARNGRRSPLRRAAGHVAGFFAKLAGDAASPQDEWRQIVNDLSIGIAIFDSGNRLAIWNTHLGSIFPTVSATMLLGCTVEDVSDRIAASFGNSIAASEIARVAGEIRAASLKPTGTRSDVVLPDRRRISIRPNQTTTGDLLLLFADLSDLTGLENRARLAEKRLREAFERLPISLALFSTDGRLELYNRPYVDEFQAIQGHIREGITLDEIALANWDASPDTFPPKFTDPKTWPKQKNDPNARATYVRAAKDAFSSPSLGFLDIVREHGSYRIQVVTLSSGDILRSGADITDLHQKEAEIRRLGESALAQRTALLRAVLDSIPQAIAAIGLDQRVQIVNSSMLGMVPTQRNSSGQIVDSSLREILNALGLPGPIKEQIVANPETDLEFTTSTMHGLPVRVRLVNVGSGERLLMVSDLSTQRTEEAQRLAQHERILQAEKDQAVVTLAGSIAHDFNNLLAVILGFSSLAAMQIQKMSAEPQPASQDAAVSSLPALARAIDNVVTSAKRGQRIVASIANLSKETKAEVARNDLRDVAVRTEQLLRILFPSSVRFDCKVAPMPCEAVINPTQIEQIITNLCINSLHALDSRAGRVVLAVDSVSIDGGRADGLRGTAAAAKHLGSHVERGADGTVMVFVGVLKRGTYVRLAVADDGTGFDEATAHKLFMPYFTTKEQGRGTGLGLPSVLEIVNAHQGGIHIRSQPGIGTTFMILLPADGAADPVAGPPPLDVDTIETPGTPDDPTATDGEPDIRSEIRVMVVDDEPRLVELATAILQHTGYDVEAFTDPVAAANRFAAAPDSFDMVFTDQTMPNMTGLELIGRIQSQRPQVRAVICTGYSRELGKFAENPPGVAAVLRKPYTPEELTDVVRRALIISAEAVP